MIHFMRDCGVVHRGLGPVRGHFLIGLSPIQDRVHGIEQVFDIIKKFLLDHKEIQLTVRSCKKTVQRNQIGDDYLFPNF